MSLERTNEANLDTQSSDISAVETERQGGLNLNLNGLLVTRQIDNTSPGGCARREMSFQSLIVWKETRPTCTFIGLYTEMPWGDYFYNA